MNEIAHLKLSTGDEIVGFVAAISEDFYTVEYPVLLERYKETGYQFSRWFPFSVNTKSHTIAHDFIISCSDVDESVKQNYIMYALSISKDTTQNEIPYPDVDYDELVETPDDPIVH